MKLSFDKVNKRLAIKIVIVLLLVAVSFDLGRGFLWLHQYHELNAAGTCPISEAGKVTKYTPVCVDDMICGPTAAGPCLVCMATCPLVSGAVPPATCMAFSELAIAGQAGNAVIAIPAGFANMVGAPKPGDFLACLTSPIAPIQLGFATGAAMRAYKLVRIYNSIIAYFS